MRLVRSISLIASLAIVGPVAAQTAGITFGATPSAFNSGNFATRGWEFGVSQSIQVTALGLYDEGGNGFSNSHQIGLWNSSSTLLASMVMPTGTTAILGADSFRYQNLLSSVVLGAGTYRIGALFDVNDLDFIAFNAAPNGAAGFVTYIGPRLSSAGFLDPTSVSIISGGAFGPNFLFTTTSVVPEPSSLALIGLGLGVLAFARRSRN